MATYAENYSPWAWNGSAGTYRLYTVLERVGDPDVANNRSPTRVRTWLQSQDGSFNGINCSHALWFDGNQVQSYWAVRSIPVGGSLLVLDGYYWVGHNADGTRAVGAGSVFSNPLTGTHTVDVSLTLDPIPRATTPEWAGNFIAGQAKTITLPRATPSFTHDVWYRFGPLTVQINPSAGASTPWTPPLSMLEQIPNSVTGPGFIDVHTKAGDGSYIGLRSRQFVLEAPTTVIPTVSTVTWDDDNPVVKSVVGAFVQGESLVKGVVAGAGVYGSTIASKSLTAGGQTFTEAQAWQPTTSGTIAASGMVTDSRGRTASKAANFTALPYTPPSLSDLTVVRRAKTAAGAVGEGAYLRLDITAAVATLKPATVEKNALKLRVRTRPNGGAWTTRNNITHTGLSYAANTIMVTGGAAFPVVTTFDVEVTVTDALGKSASRLYRVGTTAAALDLAGNAVGVGKLWERGALDIGGDAFSSTAFRTRPDGTKEGLLLGDRVRLVDGADLTEYSKASIATPYGLMGSMFSGTTAQRTALASSGIPRPGTRFFDETENIEYIWRAGAFRIENHAAKVLPLRTAGVTAEYSVNAGLVEIWWSTSGKSLPLSFTVLATAAAIPAELRPTRDRFGVAYIEQYTGITLVAADGSLHVVNQTGSARLGGSGTIVYRP